MKIQPLDDRVLVVPAGEEEKTASGIIIPDTAKENHVVVLLLLSAMMKNCRSWSRRVMLSSMASMLVTSFRMMAQTT